MATVKLLRPMQVLITPLAYHKMSLYTSLSEDEVGWFGSAEKLPDGTIRITNTYLVEQNVHGATCEITPEGTGELFHSLLGEPNGVELCESIKVWGHSHVNMGVFASAQDDDQLLTFAENNPWFVRIITNKKGEVRVDYLDVERGIIAEQLDWSIDFGLNLADEIQKELDEKVSKLVTTYGKGYKPAAKKEAKPKEEKQEEPTEVIYIGGKDTEHWWDKETIFLDTIDDVYNNVDYSILLDFLYLYDIQDEDCMIEDIVNTLSEVDKFAGLTLLEAEVVLQAVKEMYNNMYGGGVYHGLQ